MVLGFVFLWFVVLGSGPQHKRVTSCYGQQHGWLPTCWQLLAP
jgi:hypothetical protein